MNNKYKEMKHKFDTYVKKFKMKDSEDQKNIDLKISHSYRVTEEMKNIIEVFNLSEEEKALAKIIALFHDIGRFRQYEKYHTFSDYRSEDHGDLGVKVLKDNNFLIDMDSSQKNIIYDAIQLHNKPELPENRDKLFYAKLIRDADKLDIYNIFREKYKKENENNYIIKLSHEDKISDEIYEKVINGELIKYSKLKTVNDLKLMQIAWIYDINFPRTFKIIKERKYIETIYNSMPNNEKTNRIYEKINNYLNKQLQLPTNR